MTNNIKQFRYIGWIAIICSLFGSLLMFMIGAVKTYYAFAAVFIGKVPKEIFANLDVYDIATAYLIKSVDAFLIALVLFIFAYGVHSLFIAINKEEAKGDILSWIQIPSISHLKNVLAEVIIIILFVKFLETVLVRIDRLEWEILTLPTSILLLALALKFLGLRTGSLKS